MTSQQSQGSPTPPGDAPRAHRDAPRGYLLLEQLMAAGILAATLVIAYAALAKGNRDISYMGHRAAATSAAAAKLHELAADPQSLVPLTVDDMTDWPEPFKMEFEVTASGLESSSTPALGAADELFLIRVEVTFPAARGVEKIVMTRLKRKRA